MVADCRCKRCRHSWLELWGTRHTEGIGRLRWCPRRRRGVGRTCGRTAGSEVSRGVRAARQGADDRRGNFGVPSVGWRAAVNDNTPRDIQGNPLQVGRWYWVREPGAKTRGVVQIEEIWPGGHVVVATSNGCYPADYQFRPADGPPAWPGEAI